MMPPGTLRRIAIFLAAGAILLLALTASLRSILFRDDLTLRLQQRFGVSATVQDLGWRQLNLNRVAWGSAGGETIEAEGMTINYTVTGLLAKTVDGVTVSGLTIHLVHGPGGLRLRGFPDSPPKKSSLVADNGSAGFGLPITLRELDIHAGRVVIHGPDSTLDIPFQLQLRSSKDQAGLLSLIAELLAGSPTASAHGQIDLTHATAQVELLCPLPALANFWPKLANVLQLPPAYRPALDMTGTLSAKITAGGNGTHHEVKADVSLTDASLSLAENNVAVNGLAGTIHLPSLFSAGSSGKGALKFRNAAIAGLDLTGGEITFHRNGPDSLIVDRMRAGWMGGTIQALELSLTTGGTPSLTGDMHCERLDLAQLLKLMGIPRVSGSGTLSGHIPLHYAEGKIWITEGVLSTLPGGGSLRLAARELITAGVPAGSPQFGQLEFAAAALEDFSYQSLAMTLNSKGEEMMIAMSLDGHPAKPLPFRYDAQLGTFATVSGSGEIGVSQPVRLDVNFRLPLNEFLGYGKSIKNLRDQFH